MQLRHLIDQLVLMSCFTGTSLKVAALYRIVGFYAKTALEKIMFEYKTFFTLP